MDDSSTEAMETEISFLKRLNRAQHDMIALLQEDARKNSHEIVQTRWDCGCITCICEEDQCQGCGARACSDYPLCACGVNGLDPEDVTREEVQNRIRFLRLETQLDELHEFKDSILLVHRLRGDILFEMGALLSDAALVKRGEGGIDGVRRAIRYIERLRKELGEARAELEKKSTLDELLGAFRIITGP